MTSAAINIDKQRHAEKITTFCAAVERAGFSAVERVIGGSAASKLELARDAARRQQHCNIVAGYLTVAQIRFDSMAGEDCPDLYETLANIAMPAVQAGSVVLAGGGERQFSFYFNQKFVGAITASSAEEALSKATEQAVSRRFAPQKPLAEVQALCEVRAASRNFY